MNRNVLRIASVCMAGVLCMTPLTAYAADNTNNSASAGIALAMKQLSDNKSEKTSIGDTTVGTAGIAVAFGNYFNAEKDKATASVTSINKILKLAPAEEEKPAEPTPTPAPAPAPAQPVVDGYTNLGVANVTNYLNVRENPALDASVLGKLPMNAGCEILQTLDGWYQIKSGDVTGYVSAEFLLVGDAANERAAQAAQTVATVTADKLMVREQPNTECTILNRVAAQEDLEVVAVLDGWVQVNLSGTSGYVCSDYVTVHKALPKGSTLEQLTQTAEDNAVDQGVSIVEYAKQFLGNPYVWGGTSLTNGCDCSGFTMRIYEHFGYSISRTSGAQSGNGTRVALSDIQPGDLLFYSYGGSIGHVAMYIGGGRIIHASTEKTGICLGNAYFMTPTCAVRIAG